MSAAQDHATSKEPLPPGTAVALLALALGVVVIGNDFTALNVALPAIEDSLDVDVGTVQWVVNAYALTFGMAIVTGGRLADMYGRRRIFFIGAAIFAGFSLLGGLAPDAGTLIATRVAMGIGGALMWPAILGMTYAILPDSRAGLAVGLILGAAGLSNAMGPLLGGILTDELSWRWILFLNIPIAALACMVIAARVPKDEEGAREGIDFAGIATLSLGLVLLLVGFDQAGEWGFGDPRVIAFFALAVVLVAAFAFLELRQRERALVPRDVFGNGAFRATCIAVLLFSATFFAIILYTPQFLEKILDWSALEAGVGMLPMLATFGVVSIVAGNLYERLGAKLAVTLGAGAIVLGMLLLSLISDDWGYASFVPGLAVCGLGFGLFYSSVTTAGVTALDPLALEPRRRDHLHVPDRRRGDRAGCHDLDLHDHVGERAQKQGGGGGLPAHRAPVERPPRPARRHRHERRRGARARDDGARARRGHRPRLRRVRHPVRLPLRPDRGRHRLPRLARLRGGRLGRSAPGKGEGTA